MNKRTISSDILDDHIKRIMQNTSGANALRSGSFTENFNYLPEFKQVVISNLIITNNEDHKLTIREDSIKVKFDSCDFLDKTTFLTTSRSNKNNVSFTRCEFKEDIVFSLFTKAIYIEACTFSKELKFERVSNELYILNHSSIESLFIHDSINDHITLGNSKIRNILIRSSEAGKKDFSIKVYDIEGHKFRLFLEYNLNINFIDNSINSVNLYCPNSDLTIEEDEKRLKERDLPLALGYESISISYVKSLILSQVNIKNSLQLSNINKNSQLELKKIKFCPDAVLMFIDSNLSNTFLSNTSLLDIVFIINNTVIKNFVLDNVKWDLKPRIQTNEENKMELEYLVTIYRDLKNIYLKYQDSLHAEQFFNLERKILLKSLWVREDTFSTKLSNTIILCFNTITGNGFSYMRPILLSLFLSLVLSNLDNNFIILKDHCYQGIFKKVYMYAFPFRFIEVVNNKFTYLLFSVFNSAILFQALQAFRRFNKKF